MVVVRRQKSRGIQLAVRLDQRMDAWPENRMVRARHVVDEHSIACVAVTVDTIAVARLRSTSEGGS